MIIATPLSFIIAVIIAGALIFLFLQLIYKERFKTQEGRISIRNDRLELMQNHIDLMRSQFENLYKGSQQKLTLTSFTLVIQGGNVFVPTEEPTLTGLSLDVVISNTGAPSVVLDWKLSVIPVTGSPRSAQLTKIPSSLVLRGKAGTAHVSESESLMESALSTPIEANIPRKGKLLFYVALPKSDVLTSVLELSATDVTGKTFMLRQDLKELLQR